jgi:hypothetical protein
MEEDSLNNEYIQKFDGGASWKTVFGRPKRNWEDNIKMYLKEMGYDDQR